MAKVNQSGRGTRPDRGWGAGILICLLAGLSARAAGQAEQSLEYRVKAAFLLNFTKFIDWPPRTDAASDAPIVICIFGKDPFGPVLEETVQGETVNGRNVVVQRVSVPPVPQACQVVFVSGSEKDAPRILSGLGRGVLTVGEGDKFVRSGGMIAFVIEGRHVRFDINQTAAANAGLKLSSKLLSVARSVEK